MKTRLLLTLILSAVLMRASAQEFQSPHFEIKRLADGVYAAIGKNGGYGISNAGIVDLGDAALVFDAFMTPQAAEDLKKAAEQLTGHPVKYLVNSHWHNDHIGGNQVFEGAAIVSTSKTRELIEEFGPEEIEYFKKITPDRLATYKAKDTSTMTPHEREENVMWIGYFEALAASLDKLKITLPNVLFDDQMTITGSTHRVQLITYGGGHTGSDLFMYLPDEKIAFLGDLLFIQNQPWLGDGDPDQLLSYVDRIKELDIRVAVPGHGPVGTLEDLPAMVEYIKAVHDHAEAYHDAGNLPSEDPTLKSPPPYNGWFLSNFYRPNVINEYDRLFGEQK